MNEQKFLETARKLRNDLMLGRVGYIARLDLRLEIKTIESTEHIKNGLDFILFDGDVFIGNIAIVEPIKKTFVNRNNEGELGIGKIFTSIHYKGEGVESILMEIAMDYARRMNRPLAIQGKNPFGLDNYFFERRGFKFEPVIYHQIVFVLGDNYRYNAGNIEKECLDFLNKDKLFNDENENKNKAFDEEIFKEVVSLINRVKSTANNAEYFPIWLKEVEEIDIFSIEIELPKLPDLTKIETLKGLREALFAYLESIKKFENMFQKFEINREDGFYNEYPLLEAEPFLELLVKIMEKEVIGESNASEHYFISIYDLNGALIPVGKDKNFAIKVTNALAPATLFKIEEDEVALIEIHTC